MPVSRFTIRSNGIIDLSINGITITGIFPYIDEFPASTVSITCGPDSVRYETEQGSIILSVRENDGTIVLSTVLEGFDCIHDVEPIGFARLEHAGGVYIQGYGMGGPSGCHRLGSGRYTSHGIIGMTGRDSCGDDPAVVLYASDHSRFNAFFHVDEHQTVFSRGWSPEDSKTDAAVGTLTAGFALENTVSGSCELPDICIRGGSDINRCMLEAAVDIAARMDARTPEHPAYHWCSWYYYYENFNQELLDGYLEGLRIQAGDGSDPGFRYIQIDAGYTDHIGDWLRFNSRYPGGLEQAAGSITEAGYGAGIWIAPFIVGDESLLYRDHPDWVVRNRDGSPRVIFRSYTEPKIWGNTDSDFFILDTTHPGALEYLRGVFETYRAYGFTLYKTDFLLWGMVDTTDVLRYDGSKTSVEILRDTLSMIRDAIGDDCYLLCSIAPFMPCIGYADGMRIAGDMGAQWTSGAYGPDNLLQELPYDNYFNNIFWQNDPDSVILRDRATHLDEDETTSLALLQALSGGIVTTSDVVTELPDDRRRLLDFIRPSECVFAAFPFLTEGTDEIVITHSLIDWNLFYVLNPTDHPIKVHYDLQELFGTGTLFQYRFDRNAGADAVSEELSFFSETLPPHRSVLLFITEEPLDERPSSLWHRTQVLPRKL